MRMRVYALLLFVVRCRGFQWKAIDDFEETIEAYSIAALNTITSIENILNASKSDSESFFQNIYSNHPVLERINEMRLPNDKCFETVVDEDKLKVFFENQTYQFQIPLQLRVLDIKERLNKLNSSIGIYRWLAEGRFESCQLQNESCMEKTNDWLKSSLELLYCTIYLNCDSHSINKRSLCEADQFACKNGKCIARSLFCDGECNCEECSDEPDDCVDYCFEFRCTDNFRCIANSTKCNGIDDCGDGTDEKGCRRNVTNTVSYRHFNCPIEAGDFLCENTNCIREEQVCDGKNDCGDWSDEGEHCKDRPCSPACARKGGVCFKGPKGFKCLDECPSDTYETSKGCSASLENPFATLSQVLEDTPRLTTRYTARMTRLKTVTVKTLSKTLEEVLLCKKQEYTSMFNDIPPSVSAMRKLAADDPFVPFRTGNGADEAPIREQENTVTIPTTVDTTITTMNADDERFPKEIGGVTGNYTSKAIDIPSSTELFMALRARNRPTEGPIREKNGTVTIPSAETTVDEAETADAMNAEDQSLPGEFRVENDTESETVTGQMNKTEGSPVKSGGKSENDGKNATKTNDKRNETTTTTKKSIISSTTLKKQATTTTKKTNGRRKSNRRCRKH